jgi:uncharacterized membrane protein YfbV (UPF0208 family)
MRMGIISDLLYGFIAVIGVVIGTFFGDALVAAIHISLFSIVLGIIGLVIAGASLKRRGITEAFFTGLGLGLAASIAILL